MQNHGIKLINTYGFKPINLRAIKFITYTICVCVAIWALCGFMRAHCYKNNYKTAGICEEKRGEPRFLALGTM